MIKKMRKETKIAGFSLAMAGLLTACLDGGGGGTTTGTTTGQFQGSYIAGVKYVTSSGITGYTNSTGHFQFRPGDTVVFYIGKLKIGSTKGQKIVYVTDLYKEEVKDPIKLQKVKNILYTILASLDNDTNQQVFFINATEVEKKYTNEIDLEKLIAENVTKGDDVELDLDGDKTPDVTINGTNLDISGDIDLDGNETDDEKAKNTITSHAVESQLNLLTTTLSKLDNNNVYLTKGSATPENCYLVYDEANSQIQLECNGNTLFYNIGTNETDGYVYIENSQNSTDKYIFITADEEKEIEFLGLNNETLTIELTNEETTTTNTTELRNNALQVFGALNGTAVRIKNETDNEEYLCMFENFNNTNVNIGEFTNCIGTDIPANSTYDVYLTLENDKVYLELKDATNQTVLKEPVKNAFKGIKVVELEGNKVYKIFPYGITPNDVINLVNSLNGTYIYANSLKNDSKEICYLETDNLGNVMVYNSCNDNFTISNWPNGTEFVATGGKNLPSVILSIDKAKKKLVLLDIGNDTNGNLITQDVFEVSEYQNGTYTDVDNIISFLGKNNTIVYSADNDEFDKGLCDVTRDKVACYPANDTFVPYGTIYIKPDNIGVYVPSTNMTYTLNVVSDSLITTNINGTDYTVKPYSITLDDVRTFLEGANNQTVNIYVGENGTTYNCTATFDSSNNTVSLSDCPRNQTLYLFEKDGLIWLDDNQTSPTEAVIDVDNINKIMYLLDNYTNLDKVWY